MFSLAIKIRLDKIRELVPSVVHFVEIINKPKEILRFVNGVLGKEAYWCSYGWRLSTAVYKIVLAHLKAQQASECVIKQVLALAEESVGIHCELLASQGSN